MDNEHSAAQQQRRRQFHLSTMIVLIIGLGIALGLNLQEGMRGVSSKLIDNPRSMAHAVVHWYDRGFPYAFYFHGKRWLNDPIKKIDDLDAYSEPSPDRITHIYEWNIVNLIIDLLIWGAIVTSIAIFCELRIRGKTS